MPAFVRPAAASAPSPPAAGTPAAWARSCDNTCRWRFSEAGYGRTGSTSSPPCPPSRRPPRRALLDGVPRPLPRHEHAALAQQRRRVLHQHRQRPHRPGRHRVVRLAPTAQRRRLPREVLAARGYGARVDSSAAWINRSITAVFRPADSMRSTSARGRAIASTSPGKPAPAPISAIRRADASSGTSSPDRLSGHVNLKRRFRVRDRRVRVRLRGERG